MSRECGSEVAGDERGHDRKNTRKQTQKEFKRWPFVTPVDRETLIAADSVVR